LTKSPGLERGVRDKFEVLVRRRRNGEITTGEWFEELDRIGVMAGLLVDESAILAAEEVRG